MISSPAFSQSDSTDWGSELRDFWPRKPALAVLYGVTQTSWNALASAIPNPGMIDLRLGRLRDQTGDDSVHIIRERFDFLSFTTISNNLGTRALNGDANISLWRIGFGHQTGYGYELSSPPEEQGLLLYHGAGAGWSRLRVTDKIASTADSTRLALYEGSFRFGMNMEAGASLRLLPELDITLAYERDIIYRRHQVGKWLGSVVTEGAGQWLIDRLVHRVMKSSPPVAPVFRFLLKNGFAFVAYQLRHSEMFFPFKSESPLANDSFKVGMRIVW